MKRLLTLQLAVALLGSTAAGQGPHLPNAEAHPAADAVRAFWQAVGDLDGERVVACLDWPNVVIETDDRGTRPAKTIVDGDAVKAEIARSRGSERKPQPGDFFGTRVIQLGVEPVNSTLVYVPHRCRVGGVGPGTEGRDRREFDAVAIVRMDHVTRTWRIMVITVAR